MSLCPPQRCGCTITSSTLQVTGKAGGVGYNLETYEGVATEAPDTLPGPGERFEGMRIWLTDTKRLVVWDDTAGLWIVMSEPWQYHPSGLTLGNVTPGTGATHEAHSQRRGRSVMVHGRLVLGTGGSVTGEPQIGVPYVAAASLQFQPIGVVALYDASANSRTMGTCFINAGNDYVFARAPAALSASLPFTWTSADQFQFHIEYSIDGGL